MDLGSAFGFPDITVAQMWRALQELAADEKTVEVLQAKGGVGILEALQAKITQQGESGEIP